LRRAACSVPPGDASRGASHFAYNALATTLRVRLNNGRQVTVTSEAGMTIFHHCFCIDVCIAHFAAAQCVTHHLVRIKGKWSISLAAITRRKSRTVDKNGAPLTIVQLGRRTLLPIILKH
jgi:hypothetical protein